MGNAQSVKYSILAASGADWAARGETGDMAAALGEARHLLRSGQAPRVKVVKRFLDSATGRQVTTTILEEGVSRNAGGRAAGGALSWIALAAGMFVVGFGVVFALKKFVL